MNPKIRKAREEREKNRLKILELQSRNKELDKQIREMENVDIVGLVREKGFTLEQFAELLQQVNAPAPDSNETEVESDYEN